MTKKLNQRVERVEKHSRYENITCLLEKFSVEVSIFPIHNPEGERLFSHISINQQKDKTSVEELTKERYDCYSHQLSCLSCISNPFYSGYDDGPQQNIEYDQEVL